MSKTITLTVDEEELRATLSLLNWSRMRGFDALQSARPKKVIDAEVRATNAVIREINRALHPKVKKPAPPAAAVGGVGPRVPKAEALALVHDSHAKRNGKGGGR